MNLTRPPVPRSCSAVRARRRGALAAVGVVSVLLAGCAAGPPAPTPEAPVVAAVVSEAQERRILAAVAETVAAHDTVSAAEGLRSRLTGPALLMREAELRLAEATGDERWRTDLSARTQRVVLPSEQDWPRTSYAIQDQAEPSRAPALMVLDQSAAREQYRLWGYVSLVPGVSLPRFAEPGLGSAAVAPDDDTSLVRSPQDALAGYAEALGGDAVAETAGAFADDELRQSLRAAERSQTGVPRWHTTQGTYTFTAERDADLGVRAVRAADGGALVLGALTSTQTITLGQEGAVIETETLPPAQKALLTDEEATDRLRTRYRDLVALYVPAAGSERKITLVGFRHVPVDVSRG